jgi:Tfp pilus assembly protein FimT
MIVPSFLNSRRSRAFTLVELLAVIVIIIVLFSIAVPVVNGLVKTKGLARAVSDVSEIMDLARTEAMAKGTYVWLGFKDNDRNGKSQLLIVAARSVDGTPKLRVSGQTNYRFISKVQKVDDILFTNSARLTSNVKTMLANAGVTPSAVEVSTISVTPDSMQIRVESSNVAFTSLITFTPQGEALAVSDPATASPPAPFTTQMLVGLRKTVNGQDIANDVDSAGIVLYGGTGQIRVFRP